ncbi:MAG: HNH endonuclease [Armatimonadota bacterium]|nr:HNH endonuclease [Armatimonadota bacterium]
MRPLDEKTQIVRQICDALGAGDASTASEIARRDYPLSAPTAGSRSISPFEATSVFQRDGFIDRYSGTRLVFPAVLRLLSRLLPDEFPFHTNWKMSESHIIYYELCATVDHIIPVARGGTNTADNWVTTSMAHNSAKANYTLNEIGWTLLPPGYLADWDGLLAWFLDFIAKHPEHLSENYLKTWHSAAKRVTR